MTSDGYSGLLTALIRINEDRASGYRIAMGLLKVSDIDLATLFNNIAETSRIHVTILSDHLASLGVQSKSPSGQGTYQKNWMDIRSGDRVSILSKCEQAEDIILKAYQQALESAIEIPDAVVEILKEQKEKLTQEHDMIKRLRDMQAAVKS